MIVADSRMSGHMYQAMDGSSTEKQIVIHIESCFLRADSRRIIYPVPLCARKLLILMTNIGGADTTYPQHFLTKYAAQKNALNHMAIRTGLLLDPRSTNTPPHRQRSIRFPESAEFATNTMPHPKISIQTEPITIPAETPLEERYFPS